MNKNPLPIGTPAPDFTLHDSPDQTLSLADFKGQPVVIIFYPADFSPDCGDQLSIFNEVLPYFQHHRSQVLGISVDNVWSHLAFAHDRNLHFPLLSDFHPKGAAAGLYNAYNEETGTTERAIYVIDANGLVAWGFIASSPVNPGANGALEVLEALSRGTPEPVQ